MTNTDGQCQPAIVPIQNLRLNEALLVSIGLLVVSVMTLLLALVLYCFNNADWMGTLGQWVQRVGSLWVGLSFVLEFFIRLRGAESPFMLAPLKALKKEKPVLFRFAQWTPIYVALLGTVMWGYADLILDHWLMA